MSLLQLQDIGKIYVSGKTVAVGIRGVNLSFDIGEFVAITGKSGSGKSTLLNVISGMDTYEEGELLVEGKPTSHYTQADWEEYRQKYISFIFQDYNIIESFTVQQNVELALMHIPSRRERRERALALIERVGLTEFRHHKGSKLSGGQKQRTVIARALAKDSPIILADEPTGNLDSQSAKEVIALLREISREKLVVIVTHSFDQVAEYATREIRVFDGKVEADDVLQRAEPKAVATTTEAPSSKTYQVRKGFELGLHRFIATPKLSFFLCFVMILAVIGSFFITSSLVTDMEIFQPQYIFQNIDGRLVLVRHDGAPITESELAALQAQTGAASHLRHDALLDLSSAVTYRDGNKSYSATVFFDYGGTYTPDVGRLPEAKDEALLYLPLSWQAVYGKDSLEKDTFEPFHGVQMKVCGVQYYKDNTQDAKVLLTPEGYEYYSTLCLFFVSNNSNHGGSSIEANVDITFNTPDTPSDSSPSYGPIYGGDIYQNFWFSEIRVDPSLQDGQAYFHSYSYTHFAQQIANNTDTGCTVKESTLGFRYRPQDGEEIKVEGLTLLYDKCAEPVWENESAYSYDNFYYFGGSSDTLYVSQATLNALVAPQSEAYTQASLFFSDYDAAQAQILPLREKGYQAVLANATYTALETQILKVVMTIVMILLWALLIVFLGLFLVLCSSRAMMRGRGDLGILRSMGIPTDVIRISTYAQVLLALVPALALLIACSVLIYSVPATNGFFPYMHLPQYLVLILTSVVLALFIAKKYNKKMFSDSVRRTLKGGDKE